MLIARYPYEVECRPMKVQRIGSEQALKEARVALNKALGMKAMSPDLTTRATQALSEVNRALEALTY